MRSEGWLYVIGGFAALGLLLHEGLLFLVAVILVLTAVLSRIWERYCLAGLTYRRELGQTRAFFGEEIPLTIEIVNDKPLPLAWLEVEDGVPGSEVQISPAAVSPSHIPGRRLLGILLSIRWYERIRRHYHVRCLARGFLAFGPATLRTGDVFGFATRELEVAQEDYLLVYPRIIPLDRLGLPAGDPFGDVPVHRQWLFEDPLRSVGVRDYLPGDSPRRLHWKAIARAPAQQLQVKLYEPTTSHRLLIILNINTSDQNWSWAGYDPQLLEAAITTAASVANWASERSFLVGLAANGKMFRSAGSVRIPPSRDPHQLMHVLEALARLVPMPTMAAETLLDLEARDLAYGTTVVLITAGVDDVMVRHMRRLQSAGHRPVVLLITSAERPMARLDGVPAYAIRVEDTQ